MPRYSDDIQILGSRENVPTPCSGISKAEIGVMPLEVWGKGMGLGSFVSAWVMIMVIADEPQRVHCLCWVLPWIGEQG